MKLGALQVVGVLVAMSMVSASMLTACRRSELSGPPKLKLGRSECGECGMIISEDRCACAVLVTRDGVREHVSFDDIGCMLDYERGTDRDVQIIERYVHDYENRTWLSVPTARFLFGERTKIHTPMGSGIIAFASDSAAAQAQSHAGGEVMDYARLTTARKEWMEARYGKPPEAP